MIKPRKLSDGSRSEKTLPLHECIAKTVKLRDEYVIKGVNVSTHCLITGFIAKEIIKRQPVWLQENLYPSGSELIVANHDIGKVSPTFQQEIHKAICTAENPCGIELKLTTPGLKIRHEVVSQATLTGVGRFIPEIVGRHHGYTNTDIGNPDYEIYGGQAWLQLRKDLIEELRTSFNVQLPVIKTDIQADVISGLTCVADWIGSGSDFEKFTNQTNIDYDILRVQVISALDTAGFIKPKLHKGLTFEYIFGFSPRDIQTKLSEIAITERVI